MHPKIRARIEGEITGLQKGIENAPYFALSTDHVLVAASIQHLADRRGVSFEDAVQPFIEQHIAMSNWRIDHLQKLLDKADQ